MVHPSSMPISQHSAAFSSLSEASLATISLAISTPMYFSIVQEHSTNMSNLSNSIDLVLVVSS